MATQTLTFVVLPNETSSNGALRLSVFLTPRLAGAAELNSFPDILHWATQVKNHGLKFKLTDGTHSTVAAVSTTGLRPDIWGAIFTPKTLVEPYVIPDFEKNLFISYPAYDAMAYAKFAYQMLSANVLQDTSDQEPILNTLLKDLAFRDNEKSNLDAALSQLRVSLWQQQNSGGLIGLRAATATAASTSPDGMPTTGSQPANTRDMIQLFALYHNMPPAPNRPPLPQTPADFAKLLDFHKALTAISSYPLLLRALGLVFDLEIPANALGNSPAVPGGAYSTVAVAEVTPGFKWKVAPTFFLPKTSYFRSSKQFAAAPITTSANVASGNYDSGDVIDGFLVLSPSGFHLAQIDLDGALLQALSLADAVAFADFRNSTSTNNTSVQVEQVLAALRSGGISLMASGRAEQLLQAIRDNKLFDGALTDGKGTAPRPFNVLDLVRGYRIDIFSSLTKKWYSLHRRNETFTFGASADPVLQRDDQEGFTQLATAQPAEDPTRPVDTVAQAAGAPQPGTDVYVHERVARWNGWSLSVQRPGASLNRSADPAKALDPDSTVNEAITPFKMVSTFTPVNRSLPRLRFGVRYRMRVRAVDLAGNSVRLSQPSPANLSLPSGTDLPYLRFEPVPHPVVVLVESLQHGASQLRLVIRSYNHDISQDSVATLENDDRHIFPPRASVRMVEHHGMLDDSSGHLKGDNATYNMLITRDAAEIPILNKVPTDLRAQATTPYLPDPIARGAAFRDLPNTRSNTDGHVVQDALTYANSPQVEFRPGSVTHLSFGTNWPDRVPFRLVLAEGKNKPKWDSQHRVLAVYLPKATEIDVPLSSYLTADDLSLMGVWDWLRQYLEFAELESITNGGPVFPSDGMALLTQLTLEGGHPMITPALTLTLVHAVQQPLGRPEFVMLPVVRPAGQSSALANSFSPLTAWRGLDSHSTVLLGALQIHGKSTSKVDIQATWREYIDDPGEPAPKQLPAAAHVEKIELTSLLGGVLYSDSSQTRAVCTYIPQGDTLWFSAPGDTIPGATAPGFIAAPMHVFTDTKHRRVQYQAISTSKFQEYFSDLSLTFTRSSENAVVNIPSSARPSAPDVQYVIPVFGAEKQESTNIRTIVRRGNGVRVYLGRSWYSSGESELLGVLLWNLQQNLDTPSREKYKNYITQWGMDPIWKTDFLENSPTTSDLTLAVAQAQSLSLDNTDLRVDVAGHCVFYDQQRQLWYCDIVFNNPAAYAPFVRMALARYQPHSLPGVELSHAVLADFIQLSPDRSAVLSIDPADPKTARVFVGGLTPEGPQPLVFSVNVERRIADVYSDVGWEPAPTSVVTVVEDAPGSGSPDEVLWAGTVKFKQTSPPDQFRVVIREYEVLPVDPTLLNTIVVVNQFEKRLMYAAIIPYDFPH
jgi:hypothetical protein